MVEALRLFMIVRIMRILASMTVLAENNNKIVSSATGQYTGLQ